MTAVRSFADELSTSRMLRPKRWDWLEGVLQRSNLTSSNSLRKRPRRNARKTALLSTLPGSGFTFECSERSGLNPLAEGASAPTGGSGKLVFEDQHGNTHDA